MNRRTSLIMPLALFTGATLSRIAPALGASEPISGGSYKIQVLQYGTLSMETSHIARHRSTNTYVQAFAWGELLEQTSIAQSLTDTANPKPVQLTPEQQAVLESIQSAPDAEFDSTYLNAQHQSHEILYNLQQEFLGSNPVYSNQLIHTALIASAFIQNHLYVLQQLIAAGV